MGLVDGIWIRKRMAEKDARMGYEAKRRAKKSRDRTNGYRAVCKLVDARDGSLCRVCALPLREGAHHHHIINRSLGGKDTTENLVLVCPSCHVLIHQKRVLVSGSGDGHLAVLWKGRDTNESL